MVDAVKLQYLCNCSKISITIGIVMQICPPDTAYCFNLEYLIMKMDPLFQKPLLFYPMAQNKII